MVVYMADKQKPASKVSGMAKKVTASPSVHALTDGDHGDISPSDKKRNKLGYHRTAVACGHCRKRKIRCIPAPEPSNARCQNCLRLKKDCQFFPVDQNPTAQPKRTRSESKADPVVTGSETSASSSSPKVHAGPPIIDQYDQFRTSMEATGLQNEGETEYLHTYDQRQWYTPETHQHPYWLQHDSNPVNSFPQSPYPMTPTTASQSISSQDHAYTYPTISHEQPNYQYPLHRPRDGPMIPQSGHITEYAGYRANTMPDRIAMPDEVQRSHEMHQNALKMQPQQLNNQSYAPAHGSTTQYTTNVPHQSWIPPHSGSQHHSGNFSQSGSTSAWYNHADGLSGLRDTTSSHLPRRDSALQDPIHLRSKVD